jgi:hypothetical protein
MIGAGGANELMLSNRADKRALPLADRHYSRQKPGTPQFVPPGRCAVFLTPKADALWVTAWPKAEYVQHAWAGAWMCSMFRNESPYLSSDLIRQAVAATRYVWREHEVPLLGMVTFINEAKTRKRRGKRSPPGKCYIDAGFSLCGRTKGGLYAVQLLPPTCPNPNRSSVSCSLTCIWSDEMANEKPEPKDIGNELWREYDFAGRVYRIDNPKTLFTRPGPARPTASRTRRAWSTASRPRGNTAACCGGSRSRAPAPCRSDLKAPTPTRVGAFTSDPATGDTVTEPDPAAADRPVGRPRNSDPTNPYTTLRTLKTTARTVEGIAMRLSEMPRFVVAAAVAGFAALPAAEQVRLIIASRVDAAVTRE